MSNIVTAKNSISKNLSKSEITYLDALDIITRCDSIIQEAAKNRTSSPKNIKDEVFTDAMLNTFIVTVGVAGALPAAAFLGLNEPAMLGVIASATILPITGFVMAMAGKGLKILAPFTYAKKMRTVEYHNMMLDLNESEFSQVEAKVLKKAKKSLKIVNHILSAEGRSLEYINSPGKEGFHFVGSNLKPLEAARLQVINSLQQLSVSA